MPNFLHRTGHFIKEHQKTFRTVAWLIVIGIILSAFKVYLENRFHHSAEAAVELVWWKALSLTVLDHAGVGCFAAAVLGVLIELPHMHDYFQERIQNTIISRNFIRQLSNEEQEQLQEQAFEAYFGVDELNEAGGFYKFYTQRIREHIGGPFRKGTTFKTEIAQLTDDLYQVTDTIAYTCKRGNKGLPKEAQWTTEQDEIQDLLRLDISATRPDPGAQDETYSFEKEGDCDPAFVEYAGHGYMLPLTEYAACAELAIKVTATYTVLRERPFSWSMPILSDSLKGVIVYPENLEIYVDLFGLQESMLPKKEDLRPENGVYTYRIEHDTWLLPDQGFSFHFRRTKPRT